MLELHHLLKGIAPALGANIHILSEIIKGIYCISSGGVTMKNISRWTKKGGSYRSIQRFFSEQRDWLQLNFLLFQLYYLEESKGERYVLALDETVEGKSGKKTHGINWFFSSIISKVIRSISCHTISIVDTQKESSFVLTHHQTVKLERKSKEKSSKKNGKSKLKKKKKDRNPGRPKGSKNKINTKNEGLLYKSFELLLSLVVPLFRGAGVDIRYVLGDGSYGNKTCCLIAREYGLELLSKLNRNTGLFFPYAGDYSGSGRPKKYGDKVDYDNIREKYLLQRTIKDKIETSVYQIKGVWTKHMPYLINVVIIVKINHKTKKTARVLLFSTDLALDGMKIIRFYSLRFQIEFNFRDAKQFFGLSDFKNIKPQQVENAIGLSFFMTNISLLLRQQAQEKWQEEIISIQDLKAYYRAQKYLEDILNTLEITTNPILIHDKFDSILKIGAINRTKNTPLAV